MHVALGHTAVQSAAAGRALRVGRGGPELSGPPANGCGRWWCSEWGGGAEQHKAQEHWPGACSTLISSYSLRGSSPRPMAHKTIALTTELREHLRCMCGFPITCVKGGRLNREGSSRYAWKAILIKRGVVSIPKGSCNSKGMLDVF